MLKIIIFLLLLQNPTDVKKTETKSTGIKPETETKTPVKTKDGNSTSLESGKTDTSVSRKTAEKERLILIEGFPTFDELRITCKKASSQIYSTDECKSIRALEEKYSDCLKNDIKKGCQFIKTTYNVFNYFEYYQKCKNDPGFSSDCKNISEDKYSDNISKLKKICKRKLFYLDYTAECLSILKNKENYYADCMVRTSFMYYLKSCKNYRYTKTYVERSSKPGNSKNKSAVVKGSCPVENQDINSASQSEIPQKQRKFFLMGSLRIVDDKIDSGNFTSHDKYLGISSSMGYFANKNFALSFLVSIQKDDNRSSQLYGLGFLYYLENFYIGAQFGAGRISLDDEPKAFMFVSLPVGALVKLFEHVYFDFGLRFTWNFGEEDLTVTTMEAGWMGFQVIF